MVAVVTGKSFGLEQSSAFVLGSRGQWGQSAIGRANENVFVNAATGNLILTNTDEMLIGRGLDTIISRTYNSLGGWDGDNGDGWRAGVYRRVTGLTGTVNTAGSTITRTDWDGSESVYTWDATKSAYVSTDGAGAFDTLTFASGVWTWKDGDSRVTELYDDANGGRITSSADTDGNALSYTYNGSGQLTKVTTADGQDTTLSYTGNLLTQLVTHHGTGTLSTFTRVTYEYDTNTTPRLKKVIVDLSPSDNSTVDGATYWTEYTYDGTSNRVASITQKDGSSLAITYDGSNRVSTLTQTVASGVTRQTTIGYGTNSATITDASGQVTTLNYDSDKRLTSIVAPPPVAGGSSQTTTFTYNSRGDVISVTDPTGKAIIYDDTPTVFTDQGYDANGNRTYERDGAGNTVFRKFGSNNELLAETRYTTPDADGSGSGTASGALTTRYAYDSENHLRYAVSAEGYVTEFVYNAAGQQTSVIQYAGHVYSLSGLTPTDAISETTLNSWVGGMSDKSTAKRIDTTYNYRGQIDTVTSFGKTTTAGAGDTTATTEISKMIYVYDQAGNLKSRQVDGAAATESFVYDGLNRIISSTDYGGLTTSIVFNDSSTTTAVTVGAVMTRTSTYNWAGELISVVESASGTTSDTKTYRYDAMGRLRGVTDQTGLKAYYIYDRIGRLVGEVDGVGALTEYGYDADGLLIKTVKYKTLLSSTLLTQLDSNTANFTYELSAYRPSADAADIWEWRLYDNAQRLVETIDGSGAVTTFTYDGASRLVATTRHGNRIDATTVTGFKSTPPTLTTGKPPRTATPSTAPAGYTTTAGGTSGANTMTGTSGQDFIDGQAGADTLNAAGGNDILIGDTGNDTMSGSTGADVFVFRPGDGADVITDFNRSQLDLIDLSAYGTYSSISQLSIAQSGAHTVITLSDGGTITLNNFTASTLTEADFVFADRTVRQFYDDDGRLEATLDAEGYLARFFYDAAGQLVETFAYSTVSPVAYRNGTLADLITNTTANSASDIHSWTIYDRRGLVRATINGEGDVVRYHYTALGHLDQEIRGQKLSSSELTSQLSAPYTLATLPAAAGGTVLETTAWTRDNYGRVLTEVRTLAGGATETDVYVYDGFGRLMSVTTASGTTASRTRIYQYDNQGRLTGELSSEGAQILSSYVNWNYDGTTASDARDLLTGTTSIDTLSGGNGDDRLQGIGGNDTLNGGAGNDIIIGGVGNDNMTGGTGRDIFVFAELEGVDTIQDFQLGTDLLDLRAVGGYVSIAASGANDSLITLAGGGTILVKNVLPGAFTTGNFLLGDYAQVLIGTTGADSGAGMTGGGGRDLILGLANNDTLVGGAGDDRLVGAIGGDSISGGDGNDIIYAGTSNDTSLAGGAGRDVFVFLPGDGVDTITDFQVGLDLLDFTALGSYVSLTTVGANTRINLTSGSVTLNNVSVAQLTASNFLYSTADVFRAYGTTYAYDDADRLISKVESDGTPTGGNKTLYYYDNQGRLTHSINALGEVVEYRYDSFGRQTDVVTYGTRLSSLAGLTGGLMTGGLASTLASLANSGVDSAVHTNYNVTSTVSSVTTAGGSSTSFVYDAFGEAVLKTDALTGSVNRSTVFNRDRRGLMTSTTVDFAAGGLNLSTRATYDAFGRAINTTDADGKVRQTAYDRAGRVLTTTDPLGGVTTYEYDGRGAVVTIKDRNWTSTYDSKTTFSYTAFNRQVVMTTAEGIATTTVNNAYGQTLSITDGDGRKVSYAYDRNGNLESTIVDEGAGKLNLTTQNQYDTAGRLIWTIDARGFKTSFTYDAANRVLTRKVDDGGLNLITTFEYDAKGQQTKVTDAAGRVTQVTFDLDGRTTMVTADPATLKVSTKYEYDLAGRTIKVSQGTGTTSFVASKVTQYTYDKADRLTKTQVDPTGLNLTTDFTYDKRGNVVAKQATISSGVYSTTRYVYDDDNRLVWTVDAVGAVTKTTYDGEGRVTSTTGYANQVASGTLSGWGLTITESNITSAVSTSSNDHVSRLVYDKDGRVRYAVDGLGRPTEYVYDNSGNVIRSVQYAGSITPATWTPTDVASAITTGNLATAAGTRTTRAVFDAAGRQTYSIDAAGAVVAYSYDGEGNVTKAVQFADLFTTAGDQTQSAMDTWATTAPRSTNTDNRTSRTIYDGAGRAVFAVDAESYVSKTTYDGSNNVTAFTRYAATYTVTDSTTAVALATTIGSPTGAATTTYAYDTAARLTDVTDAVGTVTHLTLNDLGLVLTSTVAYGTGSAATTTNAYDAAGRLYQVTNAVGVVTKLVLDGLGRATDSTIAFGTSSAVTTRTVYDAESRVTSRTQAYGTSSAATTTYVYDAFDNVVQITDPRNNSGFFYYDKLSRLTLQIDAENYATETSYSYDNGTLKSYSFGSEAVTVKRYALKATGTPTITTPPTLNSNAADATTIILRDKLDRVVRVIDAEGNAEIYALNAFGDRATVTNKAGGVTTNTFDKRGLLTKEVIAVTWTDAANAAQSQNIENQYSYDARGNRTQMIEAATSAEARTTNYVYDKLDRLTQQTGDQVQVVNTSTLVTSGTLETPTETIIYDLRGNIQETVNAAGARTLYYYDALDRKVGEVDAMGQLTVWTYDERNNAKTQRRYDTAITLPTPAGITTPSPVGGDTYRETLLTYDPLNRQTESKIVGLRVGSYDTGSYVTSSGTDVITKREYDAAGNVIREEDGRGNSVFHFYDKLGREIAKVDAEKYFTTWARDAEGNVTSETRYVTKLTATVTTASNPTTLASGLAATGDRTTTFTYDKNGRRKTETRASVLIGSVNPSTGALTVSTVSATISYDYNALGLVTRKTEANTSEYVDFVYDSIGRQVRSVTSQYLDQNAANVQRMTVNAYDRLGNLTQSTVRAASGTSANDRTTSYTYSAGGRMATMTDATGFTRTFGYDKAGQVVKISYTRTLANTTTTVTEAQAYRYDLMGRVIFQAAASYDGSAWSYGDISHVRYNTHGEVTGKGTTPGSSTTPVYQETYDYDKAGRLWRSNSGDGTIKLFVQDKNGNAAVVISSDGADLGGYANLEAALTALTAGGALGSVNLGDVNVTFSLYDKRNQATGSREPFRELRENVTTPSTIDTATIIRARSYNAFGEVASETDGNGNTTDFTYNTMGRLIRKQSPTVNYTKENGAVVSIRPTEDYYYDGSGRLVGVRDANNTLDANNASDPDSGSLLDAYSYIDTQDRLNTRLLQAHTGLNDDEALATAEFHADGAVSRVAYDVFGDARKFTNELGAIETRDYDKMGRVTTVTHASKTIWATTIDSTSSSYVNPNTSSTGSLVDYYGYDEMGQRVRHWNSQFGSGVVEKTDYDRQGRVVSFIDYENHATTIAYSFDAAMATNGLATYGGWVKATTNTSGRVSTEKTDYFGHVVYREDYGGNEFAFDFDKAGRMVKQTTTNGWSIWPSGYVGTIDYTYYNTSQVHLIVELEEPANAGNSEESWHSKASTTTLGYDTQGNRIFERYVQVDTRQYWVENPNGGGGPPPENEELPPEPNGYWEYEYTNLVHQNTDVTYDALNRMVTLVDTRPIDTSITTDDMPISLTYAYDANGNVRRMQTQYRDVDAQATVVNRDYWYKYDVMNRAVLSKGTFTGTAGSGTIGRGTWGMEASYDAAGQRVVVLTTNGSGYTNREQYTYSADGFLETVAMAEGTVGNPNPGSGSVITRAVDRRDALGRVVYHEEWTTAGVTAFYKKVQYNDINQIEVDQTFQPKGSNPTERSTSTYTYLAYVAATGTYDGEYLGGAASHIVTDTHKLNTGTTLVRNGYVRNTYVWADAPKQSLILSMPDTSAPTQYSSSGTFYTYNGRVERWNITDINPRSIYYVVNANGQIMDRREESNATNPPSGGRPRQLYYYFNGMQVGDIGNEGPADIDYATTISRRGQTPSNGFFAWGQTPYASFGNVVDPINDMNPGGSYTSYAVNTGDTLQSIAQNLWGDSSLWYLIAEANGLDGTETLVAGQTLSIPNKVINAKNTSETFRVYDPNEALGEIQPGQPKPPPSKKGGCSGAMIIMIIVAVVVSVVTYGAASGAMYAALGTTATAAAGTATAAAVTIAAGAVAGAAASVASQLVGMAMGVVDEFSWNAVAMGALSGAIGSGLGLAIPQGSIAGSSFLTGAVRSAAGSIITQGVAVAVGWQDKFSWLDVAVSAVSGGVAEFASSKLDAFAMDKWGVKGAIERGLDIDGVWNRALTTAASSLASAATRSVIEGSSFGDNILAELPVAIGTSIGNALASGIVDTYNMQRLAASDPSTPRTAEALRSALINSYVADRVAGRARGGTVGLLSKDAEMRGRFWAYSDSVMNGDPSNLRPLALQGFLEIAGVKFGDPLPSERIAHPGADSEPNAEAVGATSVAAPLKQTPDQWGNGTPYVVNTTTGDRENADNKNPPAPVGLKGDLKEIFERAIFSSPDQAALTLGFIAKQYSPGLFKQKFTGEWTAAIIQSDTNPKEFRVLNLEVGDAAARSNINFSLPKGGGWRVVAGWHLHPHGNPAGGGFSQVDYTTAVGLQAPPNSVPVIDKATGVQKIGPDGTPVWKETFGPDFKMYVTVAYGTDQQSLYITRALDGRLPAFTSLTPRLVVQDHSVTNRIAALQEMIPGSVASRVSLDLDTLPSQSTPTITYQFDTYYPAGPNIPAVVISKFTVPGRIVTGTPIVKPPPPPAPTPPPLIPPTK